ncbi:hypothetical protein JVT61DRAFT_12721 [Boletus reticuloceps]|uniref:Uncharacterized protein n=1 Tax=Boletus reticuloceps TaxID=495285 RepID=A0A8I2YX41_9AGAM|nr:hypothetical protein JVT61DRAFT_12721 [Boletus reticuloceps]
MLRLSSLPQFKSLLVHGPYHPSAPIHLSLSVPPPHLTLLFSPSRDALLQALQGHPDEWLNTHSGTGTFASMSSRVTVFYPPSPKHLVAVLSLLRVHDVSVPVAPKVTLDRPPTLLVLLEPSAYFFPEKEEHTVSSYLLLITHVLSTAEYLSSRSFDSSPASVVVFDTRLDQLKLPVLRTPPSSAFDERDDPEDVPRPESVLFFAAKYFELSGTFQLRGQADSDLQTSVLALHRTGQGEIQSIRL